MRRDPILFRFMLNGKEAIVRHPRLRDQKDLAALKSHTRFSEDWLVSRMAQNRRVEAVVLVAEAEGRVIGVIELQRDRNEVRFHVAEVSVIFVDEAFRGKGVAKSLMRSALTAAQSIGVRVVIQYFSATNISGIAVSRSCGFVPSGTIINGQREGGKYVDRLRMAWNLE